MIRTPKEAREAAAEAFRINTKAEIEFMENTLYTYQSRHSEPEAVLRFNALACGRIVSEAALRLFIERLHVAGYVVTVSPCTYDPCSLDFLTIRVSWKE